MTTTHRLTLSDGCTVHVEETGKGRPVMLIPGLGGLAAFWQDIRDRLLPWGYRVVSFDHRGTGRSDAPAGPYAISRITRDVIEIIQALSLTHTHLVGHSTGGVIAQGVALDASEQIDKVVLSGSWAKPDKLFKSLFALRLQLLREGDADSYQRLTTHLGYAPEWAAEHWDMLEPGLSQAPLDAARQEVLCARIEMLLTEDRYDDLPGLKAPTLVIGATDDYLVPCYHAKALHARLPNARFLAMIGGHFFPKVAPDQYTEAVHSFLSEAG